MTRRDWHPQAGELLYDENERRRVERQVSGMVFLPFPRELPLIAVKGIRQARRALELPAPRRVAVSEGERDRPTIYGLECEYVNGTGRHYVYDRVDYAAWGQHVLIPLFTDWTPNALGHSLGADR